MGTITQAPWMLTLAGPALVLGAIASLVQCFLGYFLFRVLLVVLGIGLGAGLGAAAVPVLRAAPTGLDYLVLCGALAVLLGMASWWLCRLMFAVAVAACSAALVVYLVGRGHPGAGAWVLGVVLGLALGVASFLAMRVFVIVLTALFGGFAAVGSVLALATEWTVIGSSFLVLPFLVALALSVAGAVCQFKLSRALRTRLAPPHRRRGRGSRGATVHPRFTRA